MLCARQKLASLASHLLSAVKIRIYIYIYIFTSVNAAARRFFEVYLRRASRKPFLLSLSFFLSHSLSARRCSLTRRFNPTSSSSSSSSWMEPLFRARVVGIDCTGLLAAIQTEPVFRAGEGTTFVRFVDFFSFFFFSVEEEEDFQRYRD